MPPTPTNILLIRPSAMGDVARTVPLVVALRKAYPQSRIDWLVQDSFAEVVSAHPAINRAVPFPRRQFSEWFRRGQWLTLARYLRGFAKERYDLVIDAQGLARSGLIAWCTRAPVRVGHADAREGGWLGYTRRVPSNIEDHTVDRMASLVRALGIDVPTDAAAMRLYTPTAGRGFAGTLGGLSGKPYAVLAPTSRWVAKQWPDDRFAALARTLANRGVGVAIVGLTSERPQIPVCLALCRERPDVVDLVGGTSVAQLMDVIEHAALVVGNDSAALHLAVGFDRPLVALYGPTRVSRVGPYHRDADVIQHVRADDRLDHKDPAQRAIMERISVAEAVEASLTRLPSN